MIIRFLAVSPVISIKESICPGVYEKRKVGTKVGASRCFFTIHHSSRYFASSKWKLRQYRPDNSQSFFTYDLTLRDFLRRQHDASPQYPWTFNSGKLSAAANSPKVEGDIWSREVRHVTDCSSNVADIDAISFPIKFIPSSLSLILIYK